jgi:hypothetical protein
MGRQDRKRNGARGGADCAFKDGKGYSMRKLGHDAATSWVVGCWFKLDGLAGPSYFAGSVRRIHSPQWLKFRVRISAFDVWFFCSLASYLGPAAAGWSDSAPHVFHLFFLSWLVWRWNPRAQTAMPRRLSVLVRDTSSET